MFEEIVTSFPSNSFVTHQPISLIQQVTLPRQGPAFAHNLGFYDGDLDTDCDGESSNIE